MKPPSISVALCTHNGSRYLGEQLRSIARQQLAPDELIICDDVSSDGTLDIIREFSASFPVRLLRNPGILGCTRNFAQAIRLCCGDLIVLADQDDVWKPGKLAAIAEVSARHPAAGYFFSDADMVNDRGQPLGFSLWDALAFAPRQFTPPRQVALLLKRNLVTGAAMAFRSSLRDLLLPIPAAWGHDYWIALLASMFTLGVPIPERLFLYRRHPAQRLGCGKDTFLQKIRTSLAAQADYQSKAARIGELRQRVLAISPGIYCPPDHLRLLEEKHMHLLQRALIRSSRRAARVPKLLRETVSGRYRRFSFSWGSMIRDLLAASPCR